jgi:hypothetical protein
MVLMQLRSKGCASIELMYSVMRSGGVGRPGSQKARDLLAIPVGA